MSSEARRGVQNAFLGKGWHGRDLLLLQTDYCNGWLGCLQGFAATDVTHTVVDTRRGGKVCETAEEVVFEPRRHHSSMRMLSLSRKLLIGSMEMVSIDQSCLPLFPPAAFFELRTLAFATAPSK